MTDAIHDVHKSAIDVDISTLTIHAPRGPMVQVDLKTFHAVGVAIGGGINAVRSLVDHRAAMIAWLGCKLTRTRLFRARVGRVTSGASQFIRASRVGGSVQPR
jgi:hypothetical protein